MVQGANKAQIKHKINKRKADKNTKTRQRSTLKNLQKRRDERRAKQKNLHWQINKQERGVEGPGLRIDNEKN